MIFLICIKSKRMVLIKSRIYFSEITQGQKNLIIDLKKGYYVSDICKSFLESGFPKLGYYALEKLKKEKNLKINVCLSAIFSKNLDIIKSACKHFKRWDFDDECDFLRKNRCPEIIDFFISQNYAYIELADKDFSIFHYFCALKFNFRPRITVYSKKTKKRTVYTLHNERMVKLGSY